MADISKCVGSKCPRKDTCRRWLEPAERYQSYLLIPEEDQINNTCKEYWEWENGNTNLWRNSNR